jgi:cell division septum initiation protein DivIVA
VTQLTVPNPQDLQGQVLYDVNGEGIGVIEGVYLDNQTRTPEWAAVRLGPDSIALVPLEEASPSQGGVMVEFDRATVQQAPFHLTSLDNEVTEDTEQLLYQYYEGAAPGDASGNGTVDAAREVAATAKEDAAEVAATAQEEAADVAATAKEEAADVASSAKEQATDVVSTAKDQAASVVETAKEQTSEVAEVATAEAREMLDTTRTELETQAEVQLAQIAESLHRLAGQTLALARGNPEQAGPLADLVGRAGEELQSVAVGIEDRGSAGLLSDAQRVVRQRPRAAIIGTAAAVVAGARLMGTPAGERLKERIAPLKEQAVEAGKSVAEELKPLAQQRVERVKKVATEAADQVKQEAQGSVEDVKGTAKQSGETVKRSARQSAAAVKGTAKESAAAVKGTARGSATTARKTPPAVKGTAVKRPPARTPRTATPVG